MNLINRLAIICCAVVLLPSFVQCQQEWWITGGVSANRYHAWDWEKSYPKEYSYWPGFQLGVSTVFVTKQTLDLETGLLLTLRGTLLDTEEKILGWSYRVTGYNHVLYLELPFLAKYSFIDHTKGWYLCGGGFIAAAMYGFSNGSTFFKNKYEDFSETLSFGSDLGNDNLRRFDAGIIAGLGFIDPSGPDFRLTYQRGLANVSVFTDNGATINTSSLNLYLSFNFDMLFKKKEE